MNKITLYLFSFFPIFIFSQSIKIIDLETKKPIEGVRVSSEVLKEDRYTDAKGRVVVVLNKGDSWYDFVIDGYDEVGLSASEILALGYVVEIDRLKESLKEVIVSNTKWTEKKQEISRKVYQITKNDILEANPQTSADLLQKSGNIFVQKSQLGGGSPFVRGFSANRLLLSVDGIRMNNAIFRGGNLQNIISVDPLFVENSEVILGPGSIIYGSDAIGGSINFSTLKPTLAKNKKFEAKGNLLARTATANNERTFHGDINFSGNQIASVTSFSYNNFGDLVQGSHGPKDYLRNEFVEVVDGNDVVLSNSNPKKQVKSGYEQYNFLQKLVYKPNRYLNVNLGLIYTTSSEYDRYDRLQRKRNNQFRHSEWFYGPQQWLVASGVVSYKKKKQFFDELKVTNAYQNYEESRNIRDFNDSIRVTNQEKVNIYSFNFDARKAKGKLKLNYGFEYIYNKVLSNAYELNSINGQINDLDLTRYPNGSTWQSVAGYAVTNIKATKTLGLSLGMRYNHVLLRAKFNDVSLEFPFSESNINTGALTGAFGVNWKMTKSITLKANANTAFRAPNIDDVGKTVLDSEPGSLTVPNPNLKSEYAYNTEVGVNYSKKQFKFSITGYYTFLENALTRTNFELNGNTSVFFRGQESEVLAIQNSSHLYVNGLEFNSQIPIVKNLKLVGSYTVTRGKNTLSDETKVPVRHVSPDFGNAHLIYRNNKWMFDVYTEFSKAFSFKELAPSEKEKVFIYAKDNQGNPFLPSWITYNLRTSLNVTKQLTFVAAIENITDQRYRTYSSGISAPGINFISSLRYSF
ncbi:TonB-dependent receptor plug domain-containing protein [Aquimarina agarivorans]|uniref:TonB-dependent receptor plug domain-containing protein n=1 Tax=Aquimarina agarivorans TaxID=980584 RepID=UPI000248FCAD|nr:TonB-dependent receptor [Aquimarina agarivorans]